MEMRKAGEGRKQGKAPAPYCLSSGCVRTKTKGNVRRKEKHTVSQMDVKFNRTNPKITNINNN